MITVAYIDELCGDAQLIAGFAHASFQHRAHVQLIADFMKDVLFILPLNANRTFALAAQSRHFRQYIDQFLGHAVAQVFVVLVALMFRMAATAMDLASAAGVIVDLVERSN